VHKKEQKINTIVRRAVKVLALFVSDYKFPGACFSNATVDFPKADGFIEL
jgi:hypothetical protein